MPAVLRKARIADMSQTVTVAEAQARLSELVAVVAATQDQFDITRNGEPVAVLVSYAELAALRETIAILSDPLAVADIAEAEKDIALGRADSADDLHDVTLAPRPTPSERERP